MDEQPERVEMRSPAGTSHMVLARERERFEQAGYEYAGPFGGSPKGDAAVPVPEPDLVGEPEGPSVAPAVDATAFVQPDKQPKQPRAPRAKKT